ncbi:lipopolysaccharide specific response-7 protein [Acipenser ruthenus]|uniref:GPALPP motifs-containing protein 1 n=1 Tax=Acipenser ruthenus TaxID=7906 RepID=A0A662YLV6_ACIRT|nr:lipopolysaccharide specific response-7 protein [Acipenser ruthenus]
MKVHNRPIVGPALPPGFRKPDHDEEDEDYTGPALPPGYSEAASGSDEEEVIGPLPSKEPVEYNVAMEFDRRAQKMKEKLTSGDDGSKDLARETWMTELPPVLQHIGLGARTFKKRAGPESKDRSLWTETPADKEKKIRASGSDEEEVIGPLPSKEPVEYNVAMEFDRRAQKMKEKLTSGDDGSKDLARETWMTELPPVLQHIGLGARTFKKRAGPESKDRSLWTETPADKERKIRERLEGKETSEPDKEEDVHVSERDRRLAEQVSIHNESKRSESLINMHSKKLKKKAKADAEKAKERRAFDRDQDLQVNRFDEAQKKAVLKKSQELNTRFSHSKGSMFL